jgi:transcriptional regulator with PAS, ATPase and Fis domain
LYFTIVANCLGIKIANSFKGEAGMRMEIELKESSSKFYECKSADELKIYLQKDFSEDNLTRIENFFKNANPNKTYEIEIKQSRNKWYIHQSANSFFILKGAMNESSTSYNNENDNQLIFHSDNMKRIRQITEKVSLVDSTVLLLGESGVGKSILARFIHRNSNRSSMPFIEVNCGAIPETLIESELFGYEPGSFTGGTKSGKKGLFEMVNGGTIFLDEIGDLPLNLQVKLLHVLQESKIRRIGGSKMIDVNMRVIAATNQDLQILIDKREFRKDLFYRLNVVPITIPPLRERKDDIIVLANHFLEKFTRKYDTDYEITQNLEFMIAKMEWKGNIRELENYIERLVVTNEESPLKTKTIKNAEDVNPYNDITVQKVSSLKEAKEEVERQLLKKTFNLYKNTYKVAQVLGVNQSTVVRKLHKYNPDLKHNWSD